MSQQSRLFRFAPVVGLVGLMAACAGDPSAPSAATDPSQLTPASGSGDAPTLRLRCETRSNRSKISVDGNNLTPLNGSFRARVFSGTNTATSPFQQAIGDEAEFDFDSNPNDIAAGATPIGAGFIVNNTVRAKILRPDGSTAAGPETVTCRAR